MALNGLLCADVPLRTYTHSDTHHSCVAPSAACYACFCALLFCMFSVASCRFVRRLYQFCTWCRRGCSLSRDTLIIDTGVLFRQRVLFVGFAATLASQLNFDLAVMLGYCQMSFVLWIDMTSDQHGLWESPFLRLGQQQEHQQSCSRRLYF